MEKDKIITMEQANAAVNTLQAYYQQKQAEGAKNGDEDVSSIFLIMQAGTHHISVFEGMGSNLIAELTGVMCANPDLVKIFEKALDFMHDNSPRAQGLKEMAKKVFRPTTDTSMN